MKFTKTTVEICGKDFKYARCTNKQLLEHQKAIEHKTKKFEELSEIGNKYSRDVEAIDNEIKANAMYMETINRKQDPSDKELDSVAELSLKQIDLFNKRRDIIEKSEALDKEHEKEIKQLNDYINEEYGELAELQFEGMTKEYYMENSTSFDNEIIRLLASIRQMAEAGTSSKSIERFVRKNAEANAKYRLDNSFQRE